MPFPFCLSYRLLSQQPADSQETAEVRGEWDRSRSGSLHTAGQAAGGSSQASAPDVAELPEESGLSAGVSTFRGTREESGLK